LHKVENWELGIGEAVWSSPLALASPFGRRGDPKSDGVSPNGATAGIGHWELGIGKFDSEVDESVFEPNASSSNSPSSTQNPQSSPNYE